LIGDQFDRPSNVHGKTGPKSVKNSHLQEWPMVSLSNLKQYWR